MQQRVIAGRVGLTLATINRIPPEACCHWNFGVRQVHGGSSEDHISSRPCFVEDGPTGSLHTCPGIDNADEEFVWNFLSCGYRAYRPTTKPLFTAHHRCLRLEWTQRWQNLTMAHWQHVIFGDGSRFQLYPVDAKLRVRQLPSERFQQRCQAYGVQAGGGSVHVRGAFHSVAKSPLELPYRYLTSELYRGILRNNLVWFARQCFKDNYRYQDGNATTVLGKVLDFVHQGNVSKMVQSSRLPDRNPIKHIWDELGHEITSMENLPRILVSSAKSCWKNGQKFLQNACNAL